MAVKFTEEQLNTFDNLKPYDYFEYLLSEIPDHMDDKSWKPSGSC